MENAEPADHGTPVIRLVGVYHADGTLMGELRYWVGARAVELADAQRVLVVLGALGEGMALEPLLLGGGVEQGTRTEDLGPDPQVVDVGDQGAGRSEDAEVGGLLGEHAVVGLVAGGVGLGPGRAVVEVGRCC